MRSLGWCAILLALIVLVAESGTEASVATGKESYFSPLRPVLPTHLPRFAFRSPPSSCMFLKRAPRAHMRPP